MKVIVRVISARKWLKNIAILTKKSEIVTNLIIRWILQRSLLDTPHREIGIAYLPITPSVTVEISVGNNQSPSSGVWCLGMICGSRLPARSRGISMGNLPNSLFKVLRLLPFLALSVELVTVSYLSLPKCSAISACRARSTTLWWGAWEDHAHRLSPPVGIWV